jgi:phage FluMu protein Com
MATEHGSSTQISCPHCHKTFRPRLLAGGSERHRGYKCPHCKLFVPEGRAESRAEDAPLSRDADR